jgi:hypothetical protein
MGYHTVGSGRWLPTSEVTSAMKVEAVWYTPTTIRSVIAQKSQPTSTLLWKCQPSQGVVALSGM